MAMNWDVVKAKWNQLQADARIQWGKITDDDWEQINGQRDKLIAKLQERYGWARAEAEQKVDHFFEKQNTHAQDTSH